MNMELWDIFLWALVGVFAFVIGLGSIENREKAVADSYPKTSMIEEIVKSPMFPASGTDPYSESEKAPTKEDTVVVEGVPELAVPETAEEETPTKKPAKKVKKPKSTVIECPGCGAQMKVPRLKESQEIKCKECGLSGEVEI